MLKTEAPAIVNYEKQMVAEKALHFLSLHNLPFTVFNDRSLAVLSNVIFACSYMAKSFRYTTCQME